MLRRVQVCPLDVLKSVFWFDQLESMRTNIYVERAIEIAAQSNPRNVKMGLCLSKAL
jgi:hypothetical protein